VSLAFPDEQCAQDDSSRDGRNAPRRGDGVLIRHLGFFGTLSVAGSCYLPRRSAEGLNPRPRSDDQSQRQPMARHGMFKIGGVVIWIALLAIVLSSVIRSERIDATAHSVAQLHHSAKTQH
jgi:hypothetical protein